MPFGSFTTPQSKLLAVGLRWRCASHPSLPSYDAHGPTFKALLRAAEETVDEGLVASVGLCNASAAHLAVARATLRPPTLACVQNRFSLWCAGAGVSTVAVEFRARDVDAQG